MDAIDVTDAARLVRELRAAGLAEWTIIGHLPRGRAACSSSRAGTAGGAARTRSRSWRRGERPKLSATPERRIYVGDELAQMLAASTEPWRTLFRLASVVGGRESELLGLWWEDLELARPGPRRRSASRIQVDRDGKRVALKTEESKATLPLPRSTALMLLEHKARTPAPTGAARVRVRHADRAGRSHQRNVLRALYRAQERARTPDGAPTFPELFEHDERGHLVVDEHGDYVLRDVQAARAATCRTSMRCGHGAAMDCDDAEEARDLLRHKNSQRHAGDLPGALRRSPARAAARADGNADGNIGRRS